jgi:hypothetical protein
MSDKHLIAVRLIRAAEGRSLRIEGGEGEQVGAEVKTVFGFAFTP